MNASKTAHADAAAELDVLGRLLKMELQAELEYFKEKTLRTPLPKRVEEGTTWFPVQVTKTGFATGEHVKITLAKTSPDKRRSVFQAGQVVSVFLNKSDKPEQNPSAHGVVARINKEGMTVVLARPDVPNWMFEAGKLGVDVYFDETSYREMERALAEIKKADGNREAELRDILLGHAPARFSETRFELQFPHLNASQNEAIGLVSRTLDVCVVHGPPGTGKTTTLVQAIQHTLKHEPQVLVCAPSNMAVDVLTERLAAAGVQVLRLGHPVRVSDELQQHTVDQQFVEHRDYAELKRLKRRAEETKAKAEKWKRTYVRGQRNDELREARQMQEDARVLEDFMLFEILKRAQAITCTLVGANAKILGKRQFQTVFIDEAAQALAPATFIPVLRAQRVVFAGDHMQLPPTVKSIEAGRKGLSVSLMEMCYTRHLGHFNHDTGVMLRTQYRMNAHIMAFSNQQFYHGRLEAHPSVANHTLLPHLVAEPVVNQPFEFFDTAGTGYAEEVNPETLSRYNIEEANLLLAHLHRLLVAAQTAKADAGFTIGILSPYKAQVQVLQERFAELAIRDHFPQHRYTIDTVDGFQGQERDIIYFSMVRSNPTGEIGFLGDTRRLNVAMTRARKKLVMLGDSATVGNHPCFSGLVDHAEKTGAYASGWELVGYSVV